MKKKIGIASDHGGRELKFRVVNLLQELQFDVVDHGVPREDPTSVDYPDLAKKLCEGITDGDYSRGILICGTGIGISIAANKFPNIRAALVWDEFTVKMSRFHNDANVLCLGERALNHDRAMDLVKLWLDTPFEGGRHQSRLDKIKAIENNLYKQG